MTKIRMVLLVLLLCAAGAGAIHSQSTATGAAAAAQSASNPDAGNTLPDESLMPIGGGEETIPLPETARGSLFSFWDFIRMLLIFAAVIGVIYLLYKLLRKAGAPKIGETRLLKVLSSQSLGGNRSLHLVEVGNAVYLVGAGESAVSLVAEITEKETLDNIRLQASVETGVGGRRSFADLMGGMFGRGGGKTASTGLHPLSTEFLKKQRERLKKMR